ncbi:carboxymuconolactone decarboxylase family protein [Streptomyces boncukensis]|uniref:Carboxymuconolactone decarboxylase family protein n=1 Tax=Streptomyces boncukensis TaxID=2711219 RepID=A0A6G4WX96_9ACTN|nr:carboxymuconolactone decarboxylase family protein [Streptomyces boncukensis]NGO69250.1 carboxymuconolactone decarboxylase family protein [Streptomyces boncukensis]
MTTQHDTSRVQVFKHAAGVYEGMVAFQSAAAKNFDQTVAELVKIRASQINRCAFCLDMHYADARKLGETQQRLDLIAAWDEVDGLFTEREQAALALTEAMTRLSDGHGVSDAVYARAAQHFDEGELAHLIAMIVAINAWNRFQVTQRAVPMSMAKGRA